jgi:hypothetical protein
VSNAVSTGGAVAIGPQIQTIWRAPCMATNQHDACQSLCQAFSLICDRVAHSVVAVTRVL